MTACRPWPTWATERIEIAPHDPGWQHHAARHIVRLHHLLGRWMVRPIEHIGSTAIPGLVAKPVVDLQAAVSDLSVACEITGTLRPDGCRRRLKTEQVATDEK